MGEYLFFANYLTDGEFYKHNFIYNAVVPYSFSRALRWLNEFQRNYIVLVFFASYFVYHSIAKRELSIFLLYFAFSIFTSLTIGLKGADVNHLLELMTATSILVGLSILKIEESFKKFRVFPRLLVLLLITIHLTTIVHFSYGEYRRKEIPFPVRLVHRWSSIPSEKDYLIQRELVGHISSIKGKVISLGKGGMVVLAGKEIEYDPFFCPKLSEKGFWNWYNFIQDLRQGRYSAIVSTSMIDHSDNEKTDFDSVMLQTIKDNFRIHKQIGNYYIYSFIEKE